MWKDIVFCTIIIIVITIFDYFIQDYIKDSAEEMTIKLNDLKQEVLNKEEDTINTVDTRSVRKTWEERYKFLASVIEHDELEKVEKKNAKKDQEKARTKKEKLEELEKEEFKLEENLEEVKLEEMNLEDEIKEDNEKEEAKEEKEEVKPEEKVSKQEVYTNKAEIDKIMNEKNKDDDLFDDFFE